MSTPQSPSAQPVQWLDEYLLQCGDIKLKLMPGMNVEPSNRQQVTLLKDPDFVSAYEELLRGKDFNNMVEVGVKHGGSAIFFWNLLQLQKLCCIELNEEAPVLSDYIACRDLEDDFRTYFGVNQADRPKLQQIMRECFGAGPIDIVIDDASHIYTPSLATFETLFPLLRPGGLYILEDWRASLLAVQQRKESDAEPPLHQLVHETLDFSAVNPQIMPRINSNRNFVVIERGEGALPRDGFCLGRPAEYLMPAAKRVE